MLTEDYVSFETAKFLKEKGFDGICNTAYEKITSKHSVEEAAFSDWGKLNQIKRPTLQMAMKWLREKHNIFIDVDYDSHAFKDKPFFSLIINMATNDYYKGRELPGEKETYEQACEAAIKYCLENLV